jgi:energy-coupling factor transport system ATP-binding protein
MNMNRIAFDNVSYRYPLARGRRPALDSLSFQLREGEFLILLGASGAGKSTLARLCAGVIEPTAGALQRGPAAGGGTLPVGLVTQNPEDTFTGPVVREELEFVLWNLGWDKKRIDEAVRKMLRLTGLDGKSGLPPAALSGGQKQLLALASILIADPELLVLDEPFSLLDRQGRREVERLLSRRGKGTVLYCTSELEDLRRGGRVMVLQEGALAWEGAVEKFPLDEEWLAGLGFPVPDLTRLEALLSSGEKGSPRLWDPEELANRLCP